MPRKDAAHRRVGHPRRREQLLPPGFEIDRHHAGAAQAVEQRQHLTRRHAAGAVDRDRVDRQRVGARAPSRRRETARRRQPTDTTQRRSRPSATTASSDASSPGWTCERRKRLSAGAATGISGLPPGVSSASISFRGSVPIDPAPSVITASPGARDAQDPRESPRRATARRAPAARSRGEPRRRAPPA